ncbi:MAG: hypothetical protein Q7J78_07740 [Clostridiales bacterium]|nr:hypothetical protein [Clostridiales bacterium]
MLYYLCKEAVTKSSIKNSLDEYHTQKQLLSRFLIGQILMTDPVIDCVRKTVKKMAPEDRVSNDEILSVISEEIIKREVFEGEKALEAKKRIAKLNRPAKAIPTKVVQESPHTENAI